nr:hypothetical protein BAR15_120109 [Bartonella sp. AR 15-3]
MSASLSFFSSEKGHVISLIIVNLIFCIVLDLKIISFKDSCGLGMFS